MSWSQSDPVNIWFYRTRRRSVFSADHKASVSKPAVIWRVELISLLGMKRWQWTAFTHDAERTAICLKWPQFSKEAGISSLNEDWARKQLSYSTTCIKLSGKQPWVRKKKPMHVQENNQVKELRQNDQGLCTTSVTTCRTTSVTCRNVYVVYLFYKCVKNSKTITARAVRTYAAH